MKFSRRQSDDGTEGVRVEGRGDGAPGEHYLNGLTG
jgi:hypothetical protein